jgi:hypothetical protein
MSLVNDLRQAGAATPFTIGELRALHRASHLLYTIVYKNRSLPRAKTRMRICYRESKKGSSKRKRNLPYRKITDAESLVVRYSLRRWSFLSGFPPPGVMRETVFLLNW